MATTKTDRAFKTLINKRTTSEDKRAFEEFGDRTINVHGSEVWADDIAEDDPAQAILDGAAEVRTLFEMTRDTTVGGDQAWYADSGGRLKDWISDKYGPSYTAHLFDGSDNEIFPTDASDWFFDYQTGILTFSGDPSGFDKPFKVTGYRYIGTKGAGGGGVAGPGSSTDTALPRWSGTGGDTLLDSNVTLSAADAMVFPTGGSISKPGPGASSEAFGSGALAQAASSLAVGRSAWASVDGLNSAAFGSPATVSAANAVAVGNGVVSSGARATAVGFGSYCGAADGVALGYGTHVNGAAVGAIAVGSGAKVHQRSSGDSIGAIVIGYEAEIGNATPGAGCNAAICIGENASVGVGSVNSVVIGASATVAASSGQSPIAIGQSAACNAYGGIAMGRNSSVSAGQTAAVALGNASIGNGEYGVSIGSAADVQSDYAVAIGSSSGVAAGSVDAVAIGRNAEVYGVSSGDSAGSIAIGPTATIGNATPGAGCNAAICIGESASVGVGSLDSVVIGAAATSTSPDGETVSIGPGAQCSGYRGVSIGYQTDVSNTRGIAMGQSATAAGSEAITVGANSTCVGVQSIVIGVGSSNAASNSIAIGWNVDTPAGAATNAIAIGNQSRSYQRESIALGISAQVNAPVSGDSQGAIAIGALAEVGDAAGAGCDAAICIGQSASVGVGHLNAVVIGQGGTSTASNRVTVASTLEVEIGQGLAVWGVTPPASQPAKINDPTDLTSCITSITAIIDALEGAGVTSAT